MCAGINHEFNGEKKIKSLSNVDRFFLHYYHLMSNICICTLWVQWIFSLVFFFFAKTIKQHFFPWSLVERQSECELDFCVHPHCWNAMCWIWFFFLLARLLSIRKRKKHEFTFKAIRWKCKRKQNKNKLLNFCFALVDGYFVGMAWSGKFFFFFLPVYLCTYTYLL